MEHEKLKAQFNLASHKFREGNFLDSLSLLLEIDRIIPDQPDVIHAIARTQRELGSIDEFEILAARLRDEFQDPRGEALLQEPSAPRTATTGEGQHSIQPPPLQPTTHGSALARTLSRSFGIVMILASIMLFGVIAYFALTSQQTNTSMLEVGFFGAIVGVPAGLLWRGGNFLLSLANED